MFAGNINSPDRQMTTKPKLSAMSELTLLYNTRSAPVSVADVAGYLPGPCPLHALLQNPVHIASRTITLKEYKINAAVASPSVAAFGFNDTPDKLAPIPRLKLKFSMKPIKRPTEDPAAGPKKKTKRE